MTRGNPATGGVGAAAAGGESLRGRVASGIAWSAGYQAFAALVQFSAMLVLVRILPPEEYGRWASAVGILQVFNVFNIAGFLNHALQLPAGEEPDWSQHWRVGNIVQGALAAGCAACGLLLDGTAAWRGVGSLLLLASVGLLLNTPAQMRTVMLQRRLDFRRIQILGGVMTLVSVLVILGGALAGWGAAALVIGGNVVVSLPMAADLLLVERWRPRGGWFRLPDWKAYRPSLLFGSAQMGGNLVKSARPALNATVVPAAVGFGGLGLMNRAEGLFGMTAGRIAGIVVETSYPVLPQCAGDPPRFRRVAEALLLVLASLAAAGGAALAVLGTLVSRVLYGEKWIGADPFLVPAALVGAGAALAGYGYRVLLARGRLRGALVLDCLPAAVVAPGFLAILLLDAPAPAFLWIAAAAQGVTAATGLVLVRRELEPGWAARGLAAPVVAALAAGGAGALASGALDGPPLPRLLLGAGAFLAAWVACLRVAFPATLGRLLDLAPRGGALLRGVLLLRRGPGRTP